MPEPAELIVVRHGETQWNVEGRAQGHLDTELTNLGVRQAQAVAAALADERIDAAYSSDLGRAVQTATIIAEPHNLTVQTDQRLRERHLGVWQGLTPAEFEQEYPDAYARFQSGDPDDVIPGGESARQRYERGIACVADLAARHGGQVILIVTHGGICNSVFRKVVGLSLAAPRRFSLLNASINRIAVADGQWRLLSWGDAEHLAGLDTRDDL